MNKSTNLTDDSKDFSLQKNKLLYISGSIALFAGVFSLSKYLINKFKTIKLNKFCDEYINDCIKKIKDDKTSKDNTTKNEELTSTTCAFIMNCLKEVVNFLIQTNNQDMINERRAALKDEKLYEEFVEQTIMAKEQYHVEAVALIEKKLNIDFQEIQMRMNNPEEQRNNAIALNTHKKRYEDEDLPSVDKDKLKSAYIQYGKIFSAHQRVKAQQMALAQQQQNHEQAIKVIFTNQCSLEDTIKTDFDLDIKYLNQLVERSGLLNDPEVYFFYQEVNMSEEI